MWKVVDYMEGVDGNARYPSRMPTVYGPLPVKVWVRVKGERHRKAFKQTKAHQGNKPGAIEHRAQQYAEWLATRDGLVIPADCKVHVLTSPVVVPDKVRPEQRAYAVVWDRGYRDKVKGRTVERMLTIPIPHWDWVPTCTEETLELQLAA